MAKATQVNIKVKGIDMASAVFRKVGRTAKGVAVGLAAISAAGVAAGAATLKAWDAMTKIGDFAAKAGTDAVGLQKLTGALSQLGVQVMGIDAVAQSLAMMEKNTGAKGLEGFIKVLDDAKRGGGLEALTKAFGRRGLDFAPLLNGDTEALRKVVDMMGAVDNASISAATKASNAWSLFKSEFTNAWYEVFGELAADLDKFFDGNLYGAIFKAVAWVKAAVRSVFQAFKSIGDLANMVVQAIKAPFEALGKLIGGAAAAIAEWDVDILKTAVDDAFSGGDAVASFFGSWDRVKDAFGSIWEDAAVEAQTAWQKGLDFQRAKEQATVAGAAGLIGGSSSIGAARNDLILGGSHAALLAVNRRNSDSIKIATSTAQTVDMLKEISGKLNIKEA